VRAGKKYGDINGENNVERKERTRGKKRVSSSTVDSSLGHEVGRGMNGSWGKEKTSYTKKEKVESE
jgi:hypothetical protein